MDTGLRRGPAFWQDDMTTQLFRTVENIRQHDEDSGGIWQSGYRSLKTLLKMNTVFRILGKTRFQEFHLISQHIVI